MGPEFPGFRNAVLHQFRTRERINLVHFTNPESKRWCDALATMLIRTDFPITSNLFAVYTKLMISAAYMLVTDHVQQKLSYRHRCFARPRRNPCGGVHECSRNPAPGSSELKKFNSTAEIGQYIRDSMAADQQNGYQTMVPTRRDRHRRECPATGGPGNGRGDGCSRTGILPGTVGYSQTNVQVAGVDEPDIVKNDDRYIYTISGSTLVIVDAYPAANAAIISKTEFSDTPKDLFVTGDRLVLFTSGTGTPVNIAQPAAGGPVAAPMIAVPPVRYNSPSTHAIVYDISDRKNPAVMKDYTVDGDYIDARMIGTLVYMVTREQIYPYATDQMIVPAVHEGATTVARPDVWYFDNHESQFTFTTITSLDAASGNEKDAQTYLLGSGNILYVSPDAMYVSYQKYHPVIYPVRVGSGTASRPSLLRQRVGFRWIGRGFEYEQRPDSAAATGVIARKNDRLTCCSTRPTSTP